MDSTATSVESIAEMGESPSTATSPKRRLLPRFGLRALFVFAILFSLFFAWIGRNYVRIRQEEAAIETLGRAGATIRCEVEEPPVRAHFAMPAIFRRPGVPARLVGWETMPAVREVYLRQGNRADDGTLLELTRTLATFPEIRLVGFEGPGFGEEEFAALRALPNLETLSLADADATAHGLAQLGPPMRLQKIVLDGNERESPGVVAGLRSWSDLRAVEIRRIPISREDVEALASLPNLETLILEDVSPQGDEGYVPLSKLRRCKSLFIVGSGFVDADMPYLPKEAPLETLTLDGISDEALAEIFELPPSFRTSGLYPAFLSARLYWEEGRVRDFVCYLNDGSVHTSLADLSLDERRRP